MKEKLLNTFHIFALFALVSAPLYDLLLRQGEFFLAHGAKWADLCIFIIVISLFIPSVFAAIPLIAFVFSKKAGHVVHGLVIFVALFFLALPIVKRLSDIDVVIIAVSLILCAVVLFLYYRSDLLRLFLSFLSGAVVVVPLIFILSPSIKKVTFVNAPMVERSASSAETPVVLVIFDELPLTSLMNESHLIDRSRYPGFAALADNSYWFRNATTVSISTIYAVPVILTGQNPDGMKHLPTVAEYSQNIYNLLAPTHGINAYECCFTLAPRELNMVNEEPLSSRVSLLLSDTWYIFLHLVLPPQASAKIPPVHLTWKDFAGEGSNLKTGLKGAKRRKETFLKFIESIEMKSGAATLNVIHEVIPHWPWNYYPSGATYGLYNTNVEGLDGHDKWGTREWPVIEAHRRYLLQLGFLDGLITRLIDRLKDKGLYDKSLIIVTADHGASFRSGDNFRFLSETNRVDIMPVPLFVKTPFQKEAVVSDRNVETIDIVPTIAAVLGIKIPWAVDGSNMLDESIPERTEKLLFYGDGEGGIVKKRLSFSPTVDGKYRTLERDIALFGSGIFRAGPYGDLKGRFVTEFAEGMSFLTVKSVMDQKMAVSSGIVAGTLSDVAAGSRVVNLALVRGGRIVAVTGAEPDPYRFEFLLQEDELDRDGGYEIFEIIGVGDRVTLMSTVKFSRTVEREGNVEFIVSTDDKGRRSKIEVNHGAMLGSVVEVIDRDGKYLLLKGWAADIKHEMVAEEIFVFHDGSFLTSEVNRDELPETVVIEGTPQKSAFSVRVPFGSDQGLRVFAVLGNSATELNYPYRLWIERNMTIGEQFLEGPDSRIPIRTGAVVGILNTAVTEESAEQRDAVFSGFALDIKRGLLPEEIMLFADGRLVYSDRTSFYIPEIIKQTGRPELEKAGFMLRVPFEVIADKSELRIFALSKGGEASELRYYDGWQGHIRSE